MSKYDVVPLPWDLDLGGWLLAQPAEAVGRHPLGEYEDLVLLLLPSSPVEDYQLQQVGGAGGHLHVCLEMDGEGQKWSAHVQVWRL